MPRRRSPGSCGCWRCCSGGARDVDRVDESAARTRAAVGVVRGAGGGPRGGQRRGVRVRGGAVAGPRHGAPGPAVPRAAPGARVGGGGGRAGGRHAVRARRAGADGPRAGVVGDRDLRGVAVGGDAGRGAAGGAAQDRGLAGAAAQHVAEPAAAGEPAAQPARASWCCWSRWSTERRPDGARSCRRRRCCSPVRSPRSWSASCTCRRARPCAAAARCSSTGTSR